MSSIAILYFPSLYQHKFRLVFAFVFSPVYAAIHQLGGQAGRNKKVIIPTRPYLKLNEYDYSNIYKSINKYISYE